MLVLSWSGLVGAVGRGAVTLEQVESMETIFCFSRTVDSILRVDIDEEIRVRGMGAEDGARFRATVEAVNPIIKVADAYGFVYAPVYPKDEELPRRVFFEEALARLGLSFECVARLDDPICPNLENVKAAINAAHPNLVVII